MVVVIVVHVDMVVVVAVNVEVLVVVLKSNTFCLKISVTFER